MGDRVLDEREETLEAHDPVQHLRRKPDRRLEPAAHLRLGDVQRRGCRRHVARPPRHQAVHDLRYEHVRGLSAAGELVHLELHGGESLLGEADVPTASRSRAAESSHKSSTSSTSPTSSDAGCRATCREGAGHEAHADHGRARLQNVDQRLGRAGRSPAAPTRPCRRVRRRRWGCAGGRRVPHRGRSAGSRPRRRVREATRPAGARRTSARPRRAREAVSPITQEVCPPVACR